MAAGATYEPIATTTLSSAASSITFNSIASTWTDLRLVLVFGNTSGGLSKIRFNSDSGANYSDTRIYGNGGTAGSYRYTGATSISLEDGGAPTTPTSMNTVDIFSYGGSTYKTVLATIQNDQNGSGTVDRVVGLWRSTAAISTITLITNVGNFATGTTATLYGIKAA